MPRVCTICTHELRDEIDAALVAGEPLRGLSALYRVSEDALARHKANHMPAHLAKAQEAAEVIQADNLLEQVKDLQAKALGILDKAETGGDLRTSLLAIREARSCLELLAKLLGELQQEGTVNVYVSPEWLQLRAVIIAAVEPYPQARAAILEALSEPG